MHNAKAALNIPLPKTKAITTDSSITGIEKIVSITRDKHLSNKPPQYPLNKPKGKPIKIEKNKDKNTTLSASAAPWRVLTQTSLPNLSVPQKCSNDGEA